MERFNCLLHACAAVVCACVLFRIALDTTFFGLFVAGVAALFYAGASIRDARRAHNKQLINKYN